MSQQKFPKQTKLKTFFPKVSDRIHNLNREKQFLIDQELQQKKAEDRRRADADKKAAKDEEKRQTMGRINRKRQELIDVNSANRVIAAALIDEAEVLEIYDTLANPRDLHGLSRQGCYA